MAEKVPILISLTHFCDKHGPSVILVTQSSDERSDNRGDSENAKSSTNEQVNSINEKAAMGNELLMPDYPVDSYCDSCLLLFPPVENADSDDTKNNIRSMRTILDDQAFVSTQYSSIRYQTLNLIARKVFSEETMIYDGSPFVFYDDLRGLNLVMGFKLYDENARGNERRYCLNFTIDLKDQDAGMKILSNNWNFLIGGFNKMICHIKSLHASESNRLNNIDSNEAEFKPFMGNYLRGNKSKTAKTLVELTNDNTVFAKVHKWNTYLLSSLIMKPTFHHDSQSLSSTTSPS